MKIELSEHNLNIFRERFGVLHDALIKNIEIDCVKGCNMLRSEIQVYDKQTQTWVSLKLEVVGVEELHIQKPLNHDVMVIKRMIIGLFDNLFHLNFQPLYTDVNTIESFRAYPELSKTILIVVGEKCYWEIQPTEN